VIEANGNTFTGYVNGQSVGSVTIPGYENGGIGLGIDCANHCPTFSKFSLEPLPDFPNEIAKNNPRNQRSKHYTN